jgi:hypothetical protein
VELGERTSGDQAVSGVAIAQAGPPGVLAGFTVHAPWQQGERRLAFALVWVGSDGVCSEDEEVVAQRLRAALTARPGCPDDARLRQALERVAVPVRSRLATMRDRRWASAETGGPARAVAARLVDAVREAARMRDQSAIDRLERVLGFVTGGHTAGEAMEVARLAAADPADIVRRSLRLPAPSPRWGPVEARLVGLVLFQPD